MQAERIPAEDWPDDGLPAGQFLWLDDRDKGHRTIVYGCPCGCGTTHGLPVAAGGQRPGRWGWDGNEDRPTVTPSIQIVGGCRWHGWLRGGQWVTA